MAKLYSVRGIQRSLLITILLIIVYVIVISSISSHINGPKNIYIALSKQRRFKQNCDVPQQYNPLPKKLRNEPSGEKNIFFTETWQSCDQMAHLTPRSACSVESAARSNPSWNIYLFMIDVIGYTNETSDLIQQLLSFDNVKILGVSLEYLAKDTSLYDWILQRHYEKSIFRIAHVADIARLLVLYHFSGTYVDLDMVSLRSLEHLGSNYALGQFENQIANGILNFGSDNIGRATITEAVRLLPKYWDPTDWIAIGPGLISKIFINLCGTSKTVEMIPERCLSFKTIPKDEALAIVYNSYKQRRQIFEEKFLSEALLLIQNSTWVHFANSVSDNMDQAPKNLNNLQNYLGKHKCPSTFSVIDKWV